MRIENADGNIKSGSAYHFGIVQNVLVHENHQIEKYTIYICIYIYGRYAGSTNQQIQVIEISLKVINAYKRVCSCFSHPLSFNFIWQIHVGNIFRFDMIFVDYSSVTKKKSTHPSENCDEE